MNKAVGALDPVEAVMRYHQETKHHYSRYARAPGGMDWANQPDPFRRFEGSPLIPLPVLKPDDAPRSKSRGRGPESPVSPGRSFVYT